MRIMTENSGKDRQCTGIRLQKTKDDNVRYTTAQLEQSINAMRSFIQAHNGINP